MGKKGGWFTALKRAFAPSSREKPANVTFVPQVPEKKNNEKKKKWGLGRSKHSETSPFIPLYREPSSIEKILGDAEREQHYNNTHQLRSRNSDAALHENKVSAHQVPLRRSDHNNRPEQQQQQNRSNVHQLHQRNTVQQEHTRVNVQHAQSFLEITRQMQLNNDERDRRQLQRIQVASKKPQMVRPYAPRPRIPPNHAHISAVKIQTAFRGYMARRNYRSLKGLIRLQGVMRGHSVKRQMAHAMQCMQMLVRVQAQVRTHRMEAMERKGNQQRQAMLKGDKEFDSSFGRWNAARQAEGHDSWNDSVLTKQEVDTRMRRKVEAVIKRERALAYAYSHQLLKTTPMTTHAILGRNPWWWTPLDRHVPDDEVSSFQPSTKPGPTQHEITTPRSFISSTSKPIKSTKGPPAKKSGLRDDESLTSCPAFNVPNYMAPTVAAKAKAKAKARTYLQHPDQEEKRRFSFGLGQSIASIRWSSKSSNKGSFWKEKDTRSKIDRVGTPATVVGKKHRHRSTNSVSGLSVDSTVSLPVGFGRRTFK